MVGKMPTFWCMKKVVSIYRPVSLMPICSDIVEKLLTDCIYDLLHQNCFLKESSDYYNVNIMITKLKEKFKTNVTAHVLLL